MPWQARFTFAAGMTAALFSVVSEAGDLPVSLDSPPADALHLHTGASALLDFSWARPPADAIFEVSAEEGFGIKLKSIKTRGRTRVTSVRLPSGKYFWRLSVDGQAASETRKLELRKRGEIALAIEQTQPATFVTKPENAPVSGRQFQLELTDAPAPPTEEEDTSARGGYAAVSTMIAPYSYKVVSPFNGKQGTTGSYSYTLRLSGEYIVNKRWGAYAGADQTFLSFSQGNFGRTNLEAGAKYRIQLTPGPSGWVLIPKAGPEYRDYDHIVQNAITRSIDQYDVEVFGLSAGFDLRTQFNETLSLGIKTAYFLPVALGGAPFQATISSEASYRNFNFGVQGLLFLDPKWALAGGTFAELRSISYIPQDRTQSEEIYMDGVYFFGSLIYTL